MNTERISLLIAEDHKIVRKGLKALLKLEDDFDIVAEAEHGIHAVELARQHKPKVVLMDIAMPILNGFEATRQILQFLPEMKIIILSAYADDSYVDKALELGASGFLIKQCSPNGLIHAIREVIKEEYVFSPSIEQRLIHLNQEVINRKGFSKPKSQSLSCRESQVLQLIAEGKSNKIIASILFISIKTVDKHRQNLMKKLAIHDTAGLTRYAISEGIIENSRQLKMV
jgi:DNA-binding NarL/FixJ family response regulator